MTATNIIGLRREALQQQFAELKIPNFRLKQVWHWLYHHGVCEFDAMQNVPKELREKLSTNFTIERPSVSTAQVSSDGTQKWLLKFNDGQGINRALSI